MLVWYICIIKFKCGGLSLFNYFVGLILLQRIYNRVIIVDSGWDLFFGIYFMGFNLLVLDDLFGVFFICVMSFVYLYIILFVLQMYSVYSIVQYDFVIIMGMN